MAAKKAARKAVKKADKGGRLHVRVSKHLELAVKQYADRNSTTLTDIVTRHLIALLQAEQRAVVPEAEQI
jgi:hypothetical protein